MDSRSFTPLEIQEIQFISFRCVEREDFSGILSAAKKSIFKRYCKICCDVLGKLSRACILLSYV